MVKKYIPEQGDIVWIPFDPQIGHEQKGRRPAVVISKSNFNCITKMAMVCPITSTDRNFPFHIFIEGKNIQGFVMTEQVKSLDIESRDISFVEKLEKEDVEKILDRVEVIIF